MQEAKYHLSRSKHLLCILAEWRISLLHRQPYPAIDHLAEEMMTEAIATAPLVMTTVAVMVQKITIANPAVHAPHEVIEATEIASLARGTAEVTEIAEADRVIPTLRPRSFSLLLLSTVLILDTPQAQTEAEAMTHVLRLLRLLKVAVRMTMDRVDLVARLAAQVVDQAEAMRGVVDSILLGMMGGVAKGKEEAMRCMKGREMTNGGEAGCRISSSGLEC